MPYLAPQIRTAFRSIASNTGLSSPGELEMTRSTLEVAVCRSSASAWSPRLGEFTGARFELLLQLDQ
jgi:hypothetical protein